MKKIIEQDVKIVIDYTSDTSFTMFDIECGLINETNVNTALIETTTQFEILLSWQEFLRTCSEKTFIKYTWNNIMTRNRNIYKQIKPLDTVKLMTIWDYIRDYVHYINKLYDYHTSNKNVHKYKISKYNKYVREFTYTKYISFTDEFNYKVHYLLDNDLV